MATAENAYVDPSALRSLYLHDHRSRGFCAWRRRMGDALPLTRFGRAEIVNAFALAVFRRETTPAVASAALADLDADIAAGRLALVDLLWRQALDLAATLSAHHTPQLGTRALDVLHVASAVSLECTRFVTYDERQARLARAVGLRVVAP